MTLEAKLSPLVGSKTALRLRDVERLTLFRLRDAPAKIGVVISTSNMGVPFILWFRNPGGLGGDVHVTALSPWASIRVELLSPDECLELRNAP